MKYKNTEMNSSTTFSNIGWMEALKVSILLLILAVSFLYYSGIADAAFNNLCNNGTGFIRWRENGGGQEYCEILNPVQYNQSTPVNPNTIDLVLDDWYAQWPANNNANDCVAGYVWTGYNGVSDMSYCKRFVTVEYAPGTTEVDVLLDWYAQWPANNNSGDCRAGYTWIGYNGAADISFCNAYGKILYTPNNEQRTFLDDWYAQWPANNNANDCVAGYDWVGYDGTADMSFCSRDNTANFGLGEAAQCTPNNRNSVPLNTSVPFFLDLNNHPNIQRPVSWSAPTGNPTSGGDVETFNVSFSSTGQHNVTVSNAVGGETCVANVVSGSGGPYTLTVSKNPTAGGTVTAPTGNENGISCGSNCSETYNDGTSVTLSPGTAEGYTFTSWTGHSDCSDGTVTMNANKSCTANYSLSGGGPWTLDVAVSGTGDGRVDSSPEGILNCTKSGGDCTQNFSNGTSVTLTGTEEAGSDPVAWGGAEQCINGISGNETTFTMTGDLLCTATFDTTVACDPGTITVTSNEATTWTITSPGETDINGSGTSQTHNNVPAETSPGKTWTMDAADLPGFSKSVTPGSHNLTCAGSVAFDIVYTATGGTEEVTVFPNPGNVAVGDTIQFQACYSDGSGPACTAGCSESGCSDVTSPSFWGIQNPQGNATNLGGGLYQGDNIGSETIFARYNPGAGELFGTATLNVGGALTCTSNPSSITAGGTTRLSGSGGTGSENYVFDTDGGTPSSASGEQFVDVLYDTEGTYNPTLNDSSSPEALCDVVTVTAAPPSPECDDGVDNADPEDTIADYPNDPGCSSASDDDETDVGGGQPPGGGPPTFEEF